MVVVLVTYPRGRQRPTPNNRPIGSTRSRLGMTGDSTVRTEDHSSIALFAGLGVALFRLSNRGWVQIRHSVFSLILEFNCF